MKHDGVTHAVVVTVHTEHSAIHALHDVGRMMDGVPTDEGVALIRGSDARHVVYLRGPSLEQIAAWLEQQAAAIRSGADRMRARQGAA